MYVCFCSFIVFILLSSMPCTTAGGGNCVLPLLVAMNGQTFDLPCCDFLPSRGFGSCESSVEIRIFFVGKT